MSTISQRAISAIKIGSLRNKKDNSLIVASVDGEISIIHLENFASFFSAPLFSGKPPDMGYSNVEEELKEFDIDFEKLLDPSLLQKD